MNQSQIEKETKLYWNRNQIKKSKKINFELEKKNKIKLNRIYKSLCDVANWIEIRISSEFLGSFCWWVIKKSVIFL